MSLKMNIEAAVHIEQITLKQLQKVGWAQYRISLYYESKHFKSKIYLMASNIAFSPQLHPPSWVEPSIGHDSHHCYSSKFKVHYTNDPLQDNVTFYFKGYLDLALLQKIKLNIQVDLLFAENHSANFEVIHTFVGNIKKFHNIFSFLPVDFDQLGVLKLSGLYHAALMEFKFQSSEDDAEYLEREYKTMEDYLHNLTFGYRYAELKNFYKYYRQTLENEISALQERESELSKIKDKEFDKIKFIKLNQNRKIEALLGQLYNQSVEKATSQQREQLVELILQDVLSIKALIYKVWNEINARIRELSTPITQKFKEAYEYELKERLKANIFSQRIKNHDWTFGKYDNTSKFHQEQAEIVRKKSQAEKQLWQSTFLIEGNGCFEDESKCLKIFEEIYETGQFNAPDSVPRDYEHIVVLVHGFQAHRNDFIPFKQCLEVKHNVKIYISGANIGKTEESLESCGKRLAIEINRMTQLLKRKYKISFIGHSMGGIIIRSALTYLSRIKEHFHAYVSICSPHLGYLYSTSKLVHAGLWLINTLQKCDSILELCMQDGKTLRECFLYKLARVGCLNTFKKVAFIASSQDEYVAYESARVEKNTVILTESMKDKGESQVICEMIDNILCEVQACQILRLDVVFCIEESSLDTFLGRTGHIKFLSDPHFLRQFSITLGHLFA